MNALFVERPEFSRDREKILDDDAFRALQCMMLKMPEAGVVLEGTGGLRKLRYADPHRSRGKRSGLRVIYYWCDAERQFWLFRLYVKVDVDEDTVGRRRVSGKQLARALAKPGRSLEATTRQSRKRSSHYRAPKHSAKVGLD